MKKVGARGEKRRKNEILSRLTICVQIFFAAWPHVKVQKEENRVKRKPIFVISHAEDFSPLCIWVHRIISNFSSSAFHSLSFFCHFGLAEALMRLLTINSLFYFFSHSPVPEKKTQHNEDVDDDDTKRRSTVLKKQTFEEEEMQNIRRCDNRLWPLVHSNNFNPCIDIEISHENGFKQISFNYLSGFSGETFKFSYFISISIRKIQKKPQTASLKLWKKKAFHGSTNIWIPRMETKCWREMKRNAILRLQNMEKKVKWITQVLLWFELNRLQLNLESLFSDLFDSMLHWRILKNKKLIEAKIGTGTLIIIIKKSWEAPTTFEAIYNHKLCNFGDHWRPI